MALLVVDSLDSQKHEVTPTSSVVVTKNTKGYGWEIKIYFDNRVRGARSRTVKQIQEIDAQLRKLFGEGEA